MEHPVDRLFLEEDHILLSERTASRSQVGVQRHRRPLRLHDSMNLLVKSFPRVDGIQGAGSLPLCSTRGVLCHRCCCCRDRNMCARRKLRARLSKPNAKAVLLSIRSVHVSILLHSFHPIFNKKDGKTHCADRRCQFPPRVRSSCLFWIISHFGPFFSRFLLTMRKTREEEGGGGEHRERVGWNGGC